MEIGINTYGLSKCLYEDFDGTLKKLKEAGITAIEPMIVFTENGKSQEALEAYREAEKQKMTGGHWPIWMAGEKMQLLRDAGFKIRSIHMIGPGWKEPMLNQSIDFAKEQGVRYIIINPNETSIEHAKKEFAFLPEAVKRMKENGIELMIHNHETDMQDENGRCALDYFMEMIPELCVELDVGWIKFVGKDCIKVIRQYKDRIRILHFKDVCEEAAPEIRSTCFRAVGEGSIPLADILKEAKHMNLDEVGYVIDQDDSLGDMLRDIYVSAKNLK